MTKKAVMFGEIMMRLKTEGYKRFSQAESLELTYGGSEANAAVSLLCLGQRASFVTKLPENEFGDACIGMLKKYGVDTENISRGGKRMGIYFVEKGASQRPYSVVYDRADSSISQAQMSDFDWNAIFEGATWFHFSGITMAVSSNAAEICIEACKKAKELGLTVSCDLNYRKKLWSPEKACEVMTRVMPYVDIAMAANGEIETMFGIKSEGETTYDKQKNAAKQLADKFGTKMVSVILNENYGADKCSWEAILYDEKNCFISDKYEIDIIDYMGGGDAFSAGLICAFLDGKTGQNALEFATAASCLKYTMEGDFNLSTKKEVEALIKNGKSGNAQR